MVMANGSLPGVSSRMYGTRKVLHAPRKVNIALTMIPGIDSGRAIQRNVWTAEAPSTCAASSSSMGMESRKFLRIQMANGSEVAARKTAVQVSESIMLQLTNME